MKYNKWNVFFSVIIGLMFVSTTLNAKDFDDKQYKFKISIPDSWKSNIAMDGTDKIYDFLSQDEFAMIQLRAFKADVTLSMDLLIQVYEDNYLAKGSKRANLSKNNLPSGIPATHGKYVLDEEGIEIITEVYYVLLKGQGYTITTVIPTVMLAHYQGDINQILNSFVIPGYERKVPSENNLGGISDNSNSSGLSGLGDNSKSSSGLGGLSGLSAGSTTEDNFSGLNQTENNAIQPYDGVNIISVKIGDKLISDTEVDVPKTVFVPETEVIYAVFDWIGEGASGQEMKMAWIYDQDIYTIDETFYTFSEFETEGGYNTFLEMPYQGWPEGDYHIEFSIVGQIVYEAKFSVSESGGETTQDDFNSADDAGGWSQVDESNLFEGVKVKGSILVEQNYDEYDKYDEPDHRKEKSKKNKSRNKDIVGLYNFIERSDGKDFMDYWHITINKDGTYVDKHQQKGDTYVGGEEGTWTLDGDNLHLKGKGANFTTDFIVEKNEMSRRSDSGITFWFRKK